MQNTEQFTTIVKLYFSSIYCLTNLIDFKKSCLYPDIYNRWWYSKLARKGDTI